MTEGQFFADVNLPFHVWVREGRRWVLRDAADRLHAEPGARARRERDAERREGGRAAGA